MDAGECLRGLFLGRRQHPDATGKSLESVTEGDKDLGDPLDSHTSPANIHYIKTKFLR